jgi:hypothetical protein
VDAFSYLSVLLSIVLGLGVTQVLTGLGRVIEARDRVRTFGPALIWAGVILLVHVQTWWVMFGLRAHEGWTFGAFLIVLLQPLVLYLLAALVLPADFGGAAPLDLRAHYFRHAPWFFGIGVLLLVQSVARDLVISGALPSVANLSVHVVFLVLWSGGAVTRRPGYHWFVAVATATLFCVYIAALFPQLR